MTDRPYQITIGDDIDAAWADGAQNVCATLPCGGGKTYVFSKKLKRNTGVSFAIAHRQELVSQMSFTLAKQGVVHSLQASASLCKYIITEQIRRFGRRYESPNANCIVAGVKTLLNRQKVLKPMIDRASLWVTDECHHVAGGNEWMQAVGLFPETCRGLGVTATPERADGQGIGRSASGVFDVLVSGPGMRELINAGYLTDYRVFSPSSNIDLTGLKVGKSGDYSKPKLTAAVRRSPIVGDVVKSYLRFAPGKIGVTFVPDVQTAKDIASSYTASGVPARVVHAGTPDRERYKSIEMLTRGDLKELVNVDIFGEGFDLPAIEVVSLARPTASYNLHVQQFGRGLRIMDGKKYAIIIDHVGNIHPRHGLPDKFREWSLEGSRATKRKDEDLIPTRVCRECLGTYESYERDCPYCGWQYVTQGNATIEMVEGDLSEIDPAVLAAMRGEVARVDAPDYEVGEKLRHAGAPPAAVMGAMKNHRLRQEAQTELREMIATWCGYQRAAGQSDSVIMMRFYRTFGTDILSAQALGRPEAEALTERIEERVR